MITYEVTFQNGETLHLGPFPGRNEVIERILEHTRIAGIALNWKESRQEEGGKRMTAEESYQESLKYLRKKRFEKEDDRKFKKALAVVVIAGGILAWITWQIIFF